MDITSPIVWLILAGLVATGLVLVLIVLRGRGARARSEPNYKAFFIIGLSWLSTGAVFTIIYVATDLPFFIGFPFLGLGLAYTAIGLVNREKWN